MPRTGLQRASAGAGSGARTLNHMSMCKKRTPARRRGGAACSAWRIAFATRSASWCTATLAETTNSADTLPRSGCVSLVMLAIAAQKQLVGATSQADSFALACRSCSWHASQLPRLPPTRNVTDANQRA
eukprot:scaffold124638_cov66-Phaeocystis_antarctica.AAC.3